MIKRRNSALLIGASGLVGRHLLNYLLSSFEYDKVIVLVRHSLKIKHDKLEEHIIEFDKLNQFKEFFKANDVYCTLGTTIKKAKSKEAFKRVDVDYPLEAARLAKESGAEKFLIVSSMGANPNSPVFYSKMKGELEERLKKLGFNSLHLFRPSLLIGKRKEFRFGEEAGAILAKGLFFVFFGPLKKYKPISAETVAHAMYNIAQLKKEGIYTYSSNEIVEEALNDYSR